MRPHLPPPRVLSSPLLKVHPSGHPTAFMRKPLIKTAPAAGFQVLEKSCQQLGERTDQLLTWGRGPWRPWWYSQEIAVCGGELLLVGLAQNDPAEL